MQQSLRNFCISLLAAASLAGAAAALTSEQMKVISSMLERAEKGNDEAQYEIGIMFVNGFGLEKDEKRGFEMLTKSAEQNNAKAQAALSTNYSLGLGTEKDMVAAYMWNEIAMSHSSDKRNQVESRASVQQKIFELSLTKEQVKEAKQRARDWTRNFYKQGIQQ